MSRRPFALLAVAVAVIVGGLACGVPGAAAAGPAADRVLIVGVPGLTWDDVGTDRTPRLADLAAYSAIGALSVRGARSGSCVLDGWATLGAGNRAAYPRPDDADAAAPPAPPAQDVQQVPVPRCQSQEQLAAAGLPDPVAAVARIAADPATARFGAEPAALGRAVGCAGVAGGGAALAAAAPGVVLTTTHRLPSDRTRLTTLLSGCPLTLVSLGSQSPADVDAAVGRLRTAVAGLPGRTLLVVAGISEVGDDGASLHVAMVSGPGFDGGWLTSSSTGRAPYVQLIDLAPTALRALGKAVPASANGQPVHATGSRPALDRSLARLRELNVAATVHDHSTGRFFWLLVGLDAALVVAGMLVQRSPRGSAGRRPLRAAGLVLGALPVATYLAGLVPWERVAHPALALAGAVVLADVLVVAGAVAGPWRRHPVGPPLVIVVVTLATLAGDVVTGSFLELNGLLGYNAIVAGRFTGLGNLGSALLSVAALLATAALALAASRRRRAVVAGIVVGAGLVTVAIVGAPGLGRDFGGVLATLPGFLLLAMLLTATRVTPARLGAVLGAGVVAVSALAYLDWLRPADERSHLGRFVEQLRTGEAWTVVSRKGQANLSILLHSPLAWLVPVALLAAWWLVRPGGLLRGGAGLPRAHADALRAGLLACALTLAVGAAANDSGVAVPAAAAALLVPLLVWLAATRTTDDATPRGDDATLSGRVRRAGRVTVGSRGSTVWNA